MKHFVLIVTVLTILVIEARADHEQPDKCCVPQHCAPCTGNAGGTTSSSGQGGTIVTMASATAAAKKLAEAITKQESNLAKKAAMRADFKNQATGIFSQVLDLFNSGGAKLAEVVDWCSVLVSGVVKPNGQQLIADIAAVRLELAAAVKIIDQLAKDPCLGGNASVDAFNKAIQSVKDSARHLSDCLKFAQSTTDSLVKLTAVLNKVNADMATMIEQQRISGPWALLGDLLPK